MAVSESVPRYGDVSSPIAVATSPEVNVATGVVSPEFVKKSIVLPGLPAGQ